MSFLIARLELEKRLSGFTQVRKACTDDEPAYAYHGPLLTCGALGERGKRLRDGAVVWVTPVCTLARHSEGAHSWEGTR